MTEVTNGANPPAPASAATGSSTSGASVPAPESKSAEKTDYVSKEEFAELKRSLDWATAEVRRLKSSSPAKSESTGTTPTAEKAISDRLNEVEQRQARADAKIVSSTLRDALKAHGVTPDNEEVLMDHLQKRHKITCDRETDAVTYQDDFGQAKPVAELVASFMKSKGKNYVPAPAVAGVPRANGAVAPGQAKSFSEMSQQERLELKAKDRKAYFAALQAEDNANR